MSTTTESKYYEIQANGGTVRSNNDNRYHWYTFEEAKAALASLHSPKGCKIVFVEITRTETVSEFVLS